MDNWIPLLQSLIWPLVTIGVLVWLRKELFSLLIVITWRLLRGAFEWGGLKLGQGRSLEENNLYKLIDDAFEMIARSSRNGEAAVRRVIDEEKEEITKNEFLTIDSSTLFGERGKQWNVSISQYRTVSALLDDIWATIGTLPNMSFGRNWVLREKSSRYIFTEKEIGRHWARQNGRVIDDRSLNMVGIRPGMTLEIVAPGP